MQNNGNRMAGTFQLCVDGAALRCSALVDAIQVPQPVPIPNRDSARWGKPSQPR